METSGYFDVSAPVPGRIGDHFHLYTGASATWGPRIKQHLAGDAWSSTLRRTLLAIELEVGAIRKAAIGPQDSVPGEAELTDWLCANALLGVMETSRAFKEEEAILFSEPSPLNIDRRRTAPYARRLVAARDAHFPKRNKRSSEIGMVGPGLARHDRIYGVVSPVRATPARVF